MIKQINTKFVEFEASPAYQYWLLVAITVLAGILRFYKLGEWSFWGDEMITVERAQTAFQGGVDLEPISLILTHGVFTILGVSEWSARLVPALVGIISIPVLYFPIRKMFGPAIALIAGLLLAVSPWHLYWSQNARFYSLILLFYTLALLTFYFGIEEDRPWYLLLSMVFLGLATLERLSALLLLPVIVSYVILLVILPFGKPAGLRLRNLCFFFLPGLLPGIYLAIPFLQQPSRWLNSFGFVNNDPFWISAGVIYYVGLPIVCVGFLGALYQLTKKDRAALLLGLGAVVPLLAILVIALFQYTANRYVFISLTSWIVLASVAAKELLWQTQKNTKILAVSILLILVLVPLSEIALYYKYQNGNRDNWKDAFALVKQLKGADDLVIVPDIRIGDYYLQEKTISMKRLDPEHIRETGKRAWFVEDMNVQAKFPLMPKWLAKNTRLVANRDVHVRARNFKMRVYLYDPDELTTGQVSR